MLYIAKTYIGLMKLEAKFNASGQDDIRKKATEAMKATHNVDKVMGWSVPAIGQVSEWRWIKEARQ